LRKFSPQKSVDFCGGPGLNAAFSNALEFRAARAHTVRMEHRERWISEFQCPECGTSGKAAFSEEDHPYETGDTGRVVFFCTPGFEVVPGEKRSTETRIVCSKCNTVVYGPNDGKTA
jgi:hypothetical protein